MYSSYLSVNKNFKSSINLQYDLFNKQKIEQYIPTTDLCDVIKYYVNAALGKVRKSTFLAGPYGKGKSYLMLMITFLLSKREDRELFEKIVYKIKKIDKELANLLIELDEKKISLIPVIINNNSSDDLNQNFMIALSQALSDNGLLNIIPDSVFSESLKVICKWENEAENGFDIFEECQKYLRINVDELKERLSNYEYEAYKLFNQLFECISRGVSFNPLISNDMASTYADVSNKISKFGYSGLFVVFDEFGVFLEHQTEGFGNRLNKIQQFAEKCEASDINSQLHLCCINHKDVNLYKKNNNYSDRFKQIEGRFYQIRFDRSLEENYEIICSALDKKKEYNNLVDNFKSSNKEFVELLKESNIYNNEKEVDYIISNGYPLNPISLYILIKVSEQIAQNERTLFTFISDSDQNSFSSFISKHSEGMLNVENIYDYFENIIKDSAEYQNLYLKVEYAKKILIDNDKVSIYKVIAILKIINDDIKLPINTSIISLCLGKSKKEVEVEINDLIKSDYLRKNVNDNTLDYSFNNDADISNVVGNYITKKMYNYDLSDLLNNFLNNKYYVSNHYNFENSMIRFMDSVFIESSKFNKLSNLYSLRKNNDYSDGFVINLIDDCSISEEDIWKKLEDKNQSEIVVTVNNYEFSKDFIDKLTKVVAAKNILENEKNISEGVIQVLPVMIDELSREINKYIEDIYHNSRSYTLSNKEERLLNKCIYSSLTTTYNQMVILNNEQVNKNVISSVTAKARNNVIDGIIKGNLDDFGKTSAEATIYRSFKNAIDADQTEVIQRIKKRIIDSVDTKLSASTIVGELVNKPVGMRLGVIPLFIAEAISSLSFQGDSAVDTVVLSQGDVELELNAANISKLVDNPGKYNLFYTQINSEKLEMIKNMMKLFKCDNETLFNHGVQKLVNKIRLSVSKMPRIVYNSSLKNNYLDLSKEAIEFKNMFMKYDLNSYDILFNKLPKVLGIKSYKNVYSKLSKVMNEYYEKFSQHAEKTSQNIISKFDNSEADLKTCFSVWKSQFEYIDKIIFENHEKKLYAKFNNLGNNLIDNLNDLSLQAIGVTFDDWTEAKEEQFYKVLDSMITTVKEFKLEDNVIIDEIDDNNEELSPLGQTLLSNIMETIDEYGESVSNQEKAVILRKILNDTVK